MRRVTSKDVAEFAGVSQSTVSRVLSSTKELSFISPSTAQKVKEAAIQLGYSPNPIARALRGEKTNLIGLVVREIADPFFAGLIEELSFRIRDLGLNMILGHVHSDPDEGLLMTRVLDARQCDGVIFLGDLKDDLKLIKTLSKERHPAVAMCRGSSIDSFPTVNCENRKGISLLIEYLLELGHRKIIFIDGGFIGDIRERLDAFLSYQKKCNNCQLEWLQAENNNYEGGYKAMQSIVESGLQPTAIMAADDAMAIGVLKAAIDMGFKIPEQISVTGFDDIELARYVYPALTTIHQPIGLMAEEAINLLIKQIEKKKINQGELLVSLTPELIIRDSTGSVPK